jgi:hypothetical protein
MPNGNESLWKLFGAETETGKILRSMFGDPRRSYTIEYPTSKKTVHKKPRETVPQSKPGIKYPKFTKSVSQKSFTHPARRKPLSEIRKVYDEIRHSNSEQPEILQIDREAMKSHLQDAFQFATSQKHTAIAQSLSIPTEGSLLNDIILDVRQFKDQNEAVDRRAHARQRLDLKRI